MLNKIEKYEKENIKWNWNNYRSCRKLLLVQKEAKTMLGILPGYEKRRT